MTDNKSSSMPKKVPQKMPDKETDKRTEKNTQPDTLLSLQHVSKTFGGVKALNNIDFTVYPGEVHCLAGENGCGKSTLIKIVTGVYQPDTGGHISFQGQKIHKMSPDQAYELGISVIWQDLALFPEMSVAENIAFQNQVGKKPKLINQARNKKIASSVLEKLGVHLDINKPVKDYAIAQRQVIAIARALAGDAKLIFMDEPTASLTQSETDYLLGVVNKLSNDGVAIVFVSHRLAEVLEIADRMTVIKDGNLVGVFSTKGMTQSKISELMTGKEFSDSVHLSPVTSSQTLLSVKNLSRHEEFADISFEIKKGEILGLTGLLGSGRTELALTLFGMRKAHQGQIILDGQEVSFTSNIDAIDAGIAYLSEDRLNIGLVQQQSIADNLVISSLDNISELGFVKEKQKTSTVQHWVDKLRVKIGMQADAISTLSGGNQQRIAIAKWLATNPKLLILDAPTVGVDVGARAGIFETVEKLTETGLSILLISDEVPEVYYHAHRVIHMASGKFINEFNPAETTLESIESAIYA